ncbi:MAG: hypothetical protein ACX98W_01530, partial [bacterium]
MLAERGQLGLQTSREGGALGNEEKRSVVDPRLRSSRKGTAAAGLVGFEHLDPWPLRSHVAKPQKELVIGRELSGLSRQSECVLQSRELLQRGSARLTGDRPERLEVPDGKLVVELEAGSVLLGSCGKRVDEEGLKNE